MRSMVQLLSSIIMTSPRSKSMLSRVFDMLFCVDPTGREGAASKTADLQRLLKTHFCYGCDLSEADQNQRVVGPKADHALKFNLDLSNV